MTQDSAPQQDKAEATSGERRLTGAQHRAEATGNAPSAHAALGGMGSTGPITTAVPVVPAATDEDKS